VIGYDPSASSQQPNAQFGEIVLSAPFDSVFEVRVIHGDDSQERTLKKAVEDADTDGGCALAFFTKIIVQAKYPPVRIRYDSTIFSAGTCRNIVLSAEWNLFLLPEWWDVSEYYCIGSSPVLEDGFQHPIEFGYLSVEKEVEGQGLKMLPGLFHAMFYGPGPCNDPTFLDAKETGGTAQILLSPNPAQDWVSLQIPPGRIAQATVRDAAGRMFLLPSATSGGRMDFDVGSLLPGLYFLMLHTEHGRQAVYKFVKM
jgi:hypothetical protein